MGEGKPPGSKTSSAAIRAACEAHRFKCRAYSALVAWGVTPVFLIPALFRGRGINDLLDLKSRYPTCGPSTVPLPRFLPEIVRQHLDCAHLLLMLALGIAVYYSAAVTFFLWGAHRRPASTASEGESTTVGTDSTSETQNPGVNSVRRDLVVLTASSLLIAHAGSVRDPATIFLLICPLLLNVYMILCVAIEYAGRGLGR